MRGRLVLAVLAAALFAGCALDETPPIRDGAHEIAPHAYAAATPEFAFPSGAGLRAFPLALTIENAWAKPLEKVDLRAEPASLQQAWYVGRAVGRAQVTYIEDIPYLTNADAPRSHGATGDRVRQGPTAPARLDSGDLAPGGEPRALTLPIEARYRFAGPESAELNVTVAREAAPGAAYVRIRAGAFEPSDVEVRPGEPVFFLNAGAATARATVTEVLLRLEASGAQTRLAPVDEGRYDVVVVARDLAGGRGVATGRIVADFERPAPRETQGPYTGTILCGGLDACDGVREYLIDAPYPLRELTVNVSLGSPTGTSLLMRVLHEGKLLASATFAHDDTLRVPDVPAGASRVEVEAAPGALVSYALAMELQYRLPPAPPS